MSSTTYPNQEKETNSSFPKTEADQILHLKRLLVTLKQQYEKTLSTLQEKLDQEQQQNSKIKTEFEAARKLDQEEISALQGQLISIRKTLKHHQEEFRETLKKLQQQPPVEGELVSQPHIEALAMQQLQSDKRFLEDKYEELKEEWQSLVEKYEEASEMRHLAEQEAHRVKKTADAMRASLEEQTSRLADREEERQHLESSLKTQEKLVLEMDAQLKLAQQHLAKKLKETTLLSEQLEQKNISLTHLQEDFDSIRQQVWQLQIALEQVQLQEKRAQELLQDSAKTHEVQLARWEEKYFQMCEKWQESEANLRELKKFEEKYRQTQAMILQLGTLMGSGCTSGSETTTSSDAPTLPYDLLGLNALPPPTPS